MYRVKRAQNIRVAAIRQIGVDNIWWIWHEGLLRSIDFILETSWGSDAIAFWPLGWKLFGKRWDILSKNYMDNIWLQQIDASCHKSCTKIHLSCTVIENLVLLLERVTSSGKCNLFALNLLLCRAHFLLF